MLVRDNYTLFVLFQFENFDILNGTKTNFTNV